METGARGLRTILENTLLEIMYDLPSLKGVQKVVIDELVIIMQERRDAIRAVVCHD